MLRSAFVLSLAIGSLAIGVGYVQAGRQIVVLILAIDLLLYSIAWLYPKRLAWLAGFGFILAAIVAALGSLLAIEFGYLVVGLSGFLAAWTIDGYRTRSRMQADDNFSRQTLIYEFVIVTIGVVAAISARSFRIESNFWILLPLSLALILAISVLFVFLRKNSQTRS